MVQNFFEEGILQNDSSLRRGETIRDPTALVEKMTSGSNTRQNGKNDEFNPRAQKPVVFYQGKEESAPFLVSIWIFGKMLHNCLIDSGASSNVMPLDICRNLGLVPLQIDKKVTQLDKTEVPVVGELNNIHMQLASDPRVQSCIDISVMDIPEGYGMLLSRDWARKLNGYIATDFSHMWLPWRSFHYAFLYLLSDVEKALYLSFTLVSTNIPGDWTEKTHLD